MYEGDALFYFLRSDWSPFIVAGGGFYHNVAGDHGSDFDSQFHYGIGVRGFLTDHVALRIEGRHIMTDTFSEDETFAHNLSFTVGAELMLRRWESGPEAPADKDGDGVPDTDDQCPDKAGSADTAGCPDGDGDGVADGSDRCPKLAAPAATAGCPDGDGDGIVDADDRCPKVAGVAEHKGCPPPKPQDTDGDGRVDAEDRCPDVAGPIEGYPDSDDDGVADIDDKCPKAKGPAASAGCPDTDGDGLHDGVDQCPNEAGPAKLNGCAPKFDGVLPGVEFEKNSAQLSGGADEVLDAVAAKLNKFKDIRIRIEGHTDDRLSANHNRRLSLRRANAVKKYLVRKGGAAKRLVIKGYGETRPKATNDTEEGRARNSRVEFHVLK